MSDRRPFLIAAFFTRAGLTALFIEGVLWAAMRFFSFIYVLAQEADLGPTHLTPGWVRLKFVAVSAAVAVIVFLAAGGIRNGAGVVGRVAEVLAVAVNIAVLTQGVAALLRFSGAEAVVVALLAVALATAALAALFLDLRAGSVGDRAGAPAGHA